MRTVPLAPYSANHMRVRQVRGRAAEQLCEGCCGSAAYDWALVHGKDPAEPSSYVALCRRCHYRYDEEDQRRGTVKRMQDPVWQAKRKLIPRDRLGRYAR